MSPRGCFIFYLQDYVKARKVITDMQTIVNHTPGPWTIGKQNRVQAANCVLISEREVNAPPSNNPYLTALEREANARLIASAPELLEALKAMLEWARRAKLKEPNPGLEILNAINAIAKAQGQ